MSPVPAKEKNEEIRLCFLGQMYESEGMVRENVDEWMEGESGNTNRGQAPKASAQSPLRTISPNSATDVPGAIQFGTGGQQKGQKKERHGAPMLVEIAEISAVSAQQQQQQPLVQQLISPLAQQQQQTAGVNVPVGKHSGFVQFVRKADADWERAIEKMQAGWFNFEVVASLQLNVLTGISG
ncbi:hypothetical protein B0H11DRAFT_1920940 [Mycena galericulata]|nr:hypothetical protein B0H11DRAFT_1920940 [Mycena galericulata]